MIEPLVEGGCCIIGLAALYYFQIWRPARQALACEAARERDKSPPDPDRPAI